MNQHKERLEELVQGELYGGTDSLFNLSDAIINEYVHGLVDPQGRFPYPRDYCNDITAAWPVMLANDVSVVRNCGNKEPNCDYSAYVALDGMDIASFKCSGNHDNPLRAAMHIIIKLHANKGEGAVATVYEKVTP
ncbi:hypothetical protein CPM16_003170 [Escherichia coli]|nr:hypothetical protein [Escherichia coli]